ncbi:sensor histidine kinase [Mycoplana rhizolycopersici]|uniref:histidine kinase n=1 Tax=Mycoplana rhizolycopersici TaxID=2746702 RepID=A0ABX2QKI1_9HYPH|nr:ATP-binding protein [Rhizobium rhizolycopersici]NVP58295.1 GHKL domain-containing protein [Rhizobium rhizolycopersici]
MIRARNRHRKPPTAGFPSIHIDPDLYQDLKASEARYRNLIDNVPLPLWQVDARSMARFFDETGPDCRHGGVDGRRTRELFELASNTVVVTGANDSAVDLLRAAGREELLGPVGYLFAASPDTAARIVEARYANRRNHVEEMRVRAFDGQLLEVLLFATFPQTQDCADLALIMMVDVTAQRRTEQKLQKVQADLAHASRVSALGELVATIAHEVRQPLSVIATDADTATRWLDRTEPNLSKARDLMMRVADNAHRASRVIGRIQDMTAKRDPVRTPVDINAIVEETTAFVSTECRLHAIVVSLRLHHGLPAVVGDRVQLQQILVNLLLNSIQAIAAANTERREITVETSYGGCGAISFSVRDTGGGIPPQHLDRIFEGFFSTKADGIGIGLAICRSIVADHEGSIHVDSGAGEGACFVVTLPIPHGGAIGRVGQTFV